MNFQQILKNKRKELGYTLKEIADKIGVTEATVQRWESGNIKSLRHGRITKLAEILEISPAYLMGWVEDDNDGVLYDSLFPIPKIKKIPLLGTIACGEPILAAENIEDEVDIPEHIKADFALRCKGDSMIDARINDGDIVYIKQQPTVENGTIAAVLIGDEATLKRVYISGNTLTLAPCNSKYQPFFYSEEQLNEIRIIGKAVGFTSLVK